MPQASTADRPRDNALLRALPEQERSLLASALEPVSLDFKLVLQETHRPMSHLWFPRSGVCSILTEMTDGSIVEVATVGREGMIGLPIVLGARQSAQRTIVQVAGEGDRLPVRAYDQLRERLPALNACLLRCAMATVSQIAQGSACNRLHPIEARCARWLLLTHDRVDGDTFTLTHEFLAQMLGVTRPSVTIAAGILQKAGLISYLRGVVEIVDRERLEQASCECYGLITEEFERLVGAC